MHWNLLRDPNEFCMLFPHNLMIALKFIQWIYCLFFYAIAYVVVYERLAFVMLILFFNALFLYYLDKLCLCLILFCNTSTENCVHFTWYFLRLAHYPEQTLITSVLFSWPFVCWDEWSNVVNIVEGCNIVDTSDGRSINLCIQIPTSWPYTPFAQSSLFMF